MKVLFEPENYPGAMWTVFVSESDDGFWVWCPEEKRLQLHESEQVFEDEGDSPIMDLAGIESLDMATALAQSY